MTVSTSKTNETIGSDPTTGSGGGSAPSRKGRMHKTVTPTPFAFTPGQANASVFIDHNFRTGINLFNHATKNYQRLLTENPNK